MAEEKFPAEIVVLVEEVQDEIRAGAALMRSTFAVIDGADPWPVDSAADAAFHAGVEAGMAATMSVFHRRRWLQLGGDR